MNTIGTLNDVGASASWFGRHACVAGGTGAVACPRMGAKTALLVFADGDAAGALRDAVEFDRVATA